MNEYNLHLINIATTLLGTIKRGFNKYTFSVKIIEPHDANLVINIIRTVCVCVCVCVDIFPANKCTLS